MPLIETLTFKADGYQLVGSLHLPDAPNPPVIIGCHGLLADRHSPKQTRLAEVCNVHHIAYFRFDHRGCGESQGRFAKVTSLEARCRDLYHAIQRIESHPQTGSLLGLFGSSFGGAVALATAARRPIPALVTFAAPIHSLANLPDALQELSVYAQEEPDFAQNLAFDLHPLLPAIANLLIIHGDADEVVPVDHAHRLYQSVQNPKALRIQPNGDHRMSNPEHQNQFAQNFINWFSPRIRTQPTQ
jgi:uncharacterized protein